MRDELSTSRANDASANLKPGGIASTPRVWPAKLLWTVIAMLLWALLPINPYGYYVFLRWVVCIVFLWLGRTAWDTRRLAWAFPLWGISILYNPITRVPLPRPVWGVVNVGTVIVILSFVLTSRHRAE